MNGKGKGIVLADLLTVGTKAGLKQSWAREIAEDIESKVESAGLLDCL